MAFLICLENALAAWGEMLLLGLYDSEGGDSGATRLNLFPQNLTVQYPVEFHPAAKKYFQGEGSPLGTICFNYFRKHQPCKKNKLTIYWSAR